MPPQLVTIGCRENAIALPGLKNATTYEVAKLLEKGWRVALRGPRIFFFGPPVDGKPAVTYQDSASKYLLGWIGLGEEELGMIDKWTSGMPTQRQTPVTQPTARPGDEDELDDDVPVDTVKRGKGK